LREKKKEKERKKRSRYGKGAKGRYISFVSSVGTPASLYDTTKSALSSIMDVRRQRNPSLALGSVPRGLGSETSLAIGTGNIGPSIPR
jgi:hypothetical protein